MSVIPQDLLDCATGMMSSDKEVDLRVSVGRAYYAVFHKALEVFAQKGYVKPLPTDKVSVHKHLIDHIQTSDSKLANRIHALKKKRGIVDYQLNEQITPLFAKQAVAECERILKILI